MWSTVMFAQSPWCRSTIRSCALFPFQSPTSHPDHINVSLSRPVAVRTTSPSTTRSMQVSPG